VFEVAGGSSVGLLMEVGGICTADGVCCGSLSLMLMLMMMMMMMMMSV